MDELLERLQRHRRGIEEAILELPGKTVTGNARRTLRQYAVTMRGHLRKLEEIADLNYQKGKP